MLVLLGGFLMLLMAAGVNFGRAFEEVMVRIFMAGVVLVIMVAFFGILRELSEARKRIATNALGTAGAVLLVFALLAGRAGNMEGLFCASGSTLVLLPWILDFLREFADEMMVASIVVFALAGTIALGFQVQTAPIATTALAFGMVSLGFRALPRTVWA